MSSKILYKEESYKIIGACFEVYKDKGNGFLEAVYQECLAIEFKMQKIPFSEKKSLKLSYKGNDLTQTYQPDFICYEDIIVEIKAVKKLNEEHYAQLHNYLKCTKNKLGIIVNFGNYPEIEYKRIIN